MLKKQHKLPLRKNPDFFRTATSVKGFGCVVYYQPQGSTQCVVIVSKKVAPKASFRNTIRRRVYQILEQNWEELQTFEVGLAIIITQPKLLVADRFEEQLLNTFRRIVQQY
ncbi:MAG: ribonuclease P protein component [Patescibacteria group bacterium]